MDEAFIGYPHLERQAQKIREAASQRDVNSVADPKTYALVSGLLGQTPSDLGYSVLQPDAAGVRNAGDAGVALGLLGLGIDPRAQKIFVKGLLGPANLERYRLGDITRGQAKQILEYDKSAAPTALDVFVTPDAERHVRSGRIAEQGFAPEKMGLVSRQALRADSDVMPPTGFGDYPYLLSKRMTSLDSGDPYNAMMHLKPVPDGFELVTVYPKGLPNGKTPKR